jgi:hypothetical protein
MSNIITKIKLYAEANSKVADFNPFTGNVEVSDLSDGNGQFISKWKIDGLDKPTDEQLNALSSQATTLENNAIAVANRQKEYGSIASQIEFITEKGLDAWKTNVQAIKTKFPKEGE